MDGEDIGGIRHRRVSCMVDMQLYWSMGEKNSEVLSFFGSQSLNVEHHELRQVSVSTPLEDNANKSWVRILCEGVERSLQDAHNMHIFYTVLGLTLKTCTQQKFQALCSLARADTRTTNRTMARYFSLRILVLSMRRRRGVSEITAWISTLETVTDYPHLSVSKFYTRQEYS